MNVDGAQVLSVLGAVIQSDGFASLAMTAVSLRGARRATNRRSPSDPSLRAQRSNRSGYQERISAAPMLMPDLVEKRPDSVD